MMTVIGMQVLLMCKSQSFAGIIDDKVRDRSQLKNIWNAQLTSVVFAQIFVGNIDSYSCMQSV